MANNVYIGMRYVPIFDGDWDATKSYEALTIVQYGNNTYTSKKPVPVGTLPTNTDYWALTGNYNGQIADLQNRMTALENVALRKFIVIGDSYGEGYTPDGNVTGWPTLLKNRLGLADDAFYTNSLGGAGFRSANSYLTLLQGITVADPDAITDIIVAGGHNDSVDPTGAATGISSFMSYCRTTYPNARVWCGMISYNAQKASGSANFTAETSKNTIRLYQSIAEYGGIYMNGSEFAIHDANYLASDGIHANAAGQARIADFISSTVQGCAFDMSLPKITLTVTNTNNTNNLYVDEEVINGMINFTLRGAYMMSSPLTSKTLNGAEILLGTLPKRYMCGNNNAVLGLARMNFQDSLGSGGSNQRYFSTVGIIYLQNSTNNLYWKPIQMNDARTNYYTATSMVNIQPIYDIPFYLPLINY